MLFMFCQASDLSYHFYFIMSIKRHLSSDKCLFFIQVFGDASKSLESGLTDEKGRDESRSAMGTNGGSNVADEGTLKSASFYEGIRKAFDLFLLTVRMTDV